MASERHPCRKPSSLPECPGCARAMTTRIYCASTAGKSRVSGMSDSTTSQWLYNAKERLRGDAMWKRVRTKTTLYRYRKPTHVQSAARTMTWAKEPRKARMRCWQPADLMNAQSVVTGATRCPNTPVLRAQTTIVLLRLGY